MSADTSKPTVANANFVEASGEDHLANLNDLHTWLSRQRYQLAEGEIEQREKLDKLIEFAVATKKRLKRYLERNADRETGEVTFIRKEASPDGGYNWIGKDPKDNKYVICKPQFLGPGEEYVVKAGRIMVREVGVVFRNPSYVKLA